MSNTTAENFRINKRLTQVRSLDELEALVDASVDGFNLVNLVTALHRWAKLAGAQQSPLQRSDPLLLRLLDDLDRSLPLASSFPARNLNSIAHSLARLKPTGHVRIITRVFEASLPRKHELSHVGLANLLWSGAECLREDGHAVDGRLRPLWNELFHYVETERLADDAEGRLRVEEALSLFLSAVKGRYQGREAMGRFIIGWASTRLSDFESRELANLVWGMVKLMESAQSPGHWRAETSVQRLFVRVGQQLRERFPLDGPSASPSPPPSRKAMEDWTVVLWGCARMGYYDGRLLRHAADAIVKGSLPSFHLLSFKRRASNPVNLAWAFVRADVHDALLWERLAGLLMPFLSSLSASDTTMAAWSFTRAAIRGDWEDECGMLERIASRARAHLASDRASVRDWGQWLRSFAELVCDGRAGAEGEALVGELLRRYTGGAGRALEVGSTCEDLSAAAQACGLLMDVPSLAQEAQTVLEDVASVGLRRLCEFHNHNMFAAFLQATSRPPENIIPTHGNPLRTIPSPLLPSYVAALAGRGGGAVEGLRVLMEHSMRQAGGQEGDEEWCLSALSAVAEHHPSLAPSLCRIYWLEGPATPGDQQDPSRIVGLVQTTAKALSRLSAAESVPAFSDGVALMMHLVTTWIDHRNIADRLGVGGQPDDQQRMAHDVATLVTSLRDATSASEDPRCMDMCFRWLEPFVIRSFDEAPPTTVRDMLAAYSRVQGASWDDMMDKTLQKSLRWCEAGSRDAAACVLGGPSTPPAAASFLSKMRLNVIAKRMSPQALCSLLWAMTDVRAVQPRQALFTALLVKWPVPSSRPTRTAPIDLLLAIADALVAGKCEGDETDEAARKLVRRELRRRLEQGNVQDFSMVVRTARVLPALHSQKWKARQEMRYCAEQTLILLAPSPSPSTHAFLPPPSADQLVDLALAFVGSGVRQAALVRPLIAHTSIIDAIKGDGAIRLSPEKLIGLSHVISKTGLADDTPIFEMLVTGVVSQLDRFDGAQLSRLTYALANARPRASSEPLVPATQRLLLVQDLASALETLSASALPSLPPGRLIALMWALSKLIMPARGSRDNAADVDKRADVYRLFHTVAGALVDGSRRGSSSSSSMWTLRDCTPPDLTVLCWAFLNAGLAPPSLFAAVADEATRRIDAFFLKTLARLCGALSLACKRHDDLCAYDTEAWGARRCALAHAAIERLTAAEGGATELGMRDWATLVQFFATGPGCRRPGADDHLLWEHLAAAGEAINWGRVSRSTVSWVALDELIDALECLGEKRAGNRYTVAVKAVRGQLLPYIKGRTTKQILRMSRAMVGPNPLGRAETADDLQAVMRAIGAHLLQRLDELDNTDLMELTKMLSAVGLDASAVTLESDSVNGVCTLRS
ncbi:unnamed protein product [Vitrella brassicaformis CCMP3155]|uniref:Uncharacterized protein n=2 Tax=Vitrella brassicaformis TaxID=1169539 RepID=A0A0G4EYQ3_VITBC|nr:unnamed protein product [Vitrella brassicaformis CCMP3155]|eukprot:CEM04291.1 unnamed protein product [Vitrella brassicaformis CCMP3155]